MRAAHIVKAWAEATSARDLGRAGVDDAGQKRPTHATTREETPREESRPERSSAAPEQSRARRGRAEHSTAKPDRMLSCISACVSAAAVRRRVSQSVLHVRIGFIAHTEPLGVVPVLTNTPGILRVVPLVHWSSCGRCQNEQSAHKCVTSDRQTGRQEVRDYTACIWQTGELVVVITAMMTEWMDGWEWPALPPPDKTIN